MKGVPVEFLSGCFKVEKTVILAFCSIHIDRYRFLCKIQFFQWLVQTKKALGDLPN